MTGFSFLFYMFARIGLFGFGGGYAMLPLIFQGVQEFGFMSAEEFSNLVALSQVTPGPVAVNAATYVGFNYAGVLGAAVATFGVSLPCFVIVFIISSFLEKFKNSTLVEGMFTGIRPVTVGLIASAVVVLGKTSLINVGTDLNISTVIGTIEIIPVLIFLATLLLAGKLKISPIKVTIMMGIVGALFC